MVDMSWVMRVTKNKIANVDEADGSGDAWNCLGRIYDLASHNPTYLVGTALDIDSLQGMSLDIIDVEGTLEEDGEMVGQVGL